MRLKVKEIASKKDFTPTSLHMATGLSMTTILRYWHGLVSVERGGPPIDRVSMKTLQKLADAIGVKATSLLADE